MNRVFVYGLLKPGARLHHVIAPFAARVEPATVEGRLHDAGLPAARFGGGGTIEGCLVTLADADEALRVLDDVEDEGTLYRRVVVTVRTAAGDSEAYAYEYLPDVDRLPVVGPSWT